MTKKGKAGTTAARPQTTDKGSAFTQAQAADLRELAALHREKQERKKQKKLTRELDRRYKRRSSKKRDDTHRSLTNKNGKDPRGSLESSPCGLSNEVRQAPPVGGEHGGICGQT